MASKRLAFATFGVGALSSSSQVSCQGSSIRANHLATECERPLHLRQRTAGVAAALGAALRDARCAEPSKPLATIPGAGVADKANNSCDGSVKSLEASLAPADAPEPPAAAATPAPAPAPAPVSRSSLSDNWRDRPAVAPPPARNLTTAPSPGQFVWFGSKPAAGSVFHDLAATGGLGPQPEGHLQVVMEVHGDKIVTAAVTSFSATRAQNSTFADRAKSRNWARRYSPIGDAEHTDPSVARLQLLQEGDPGHTLAHDSYANNSCPMVVEWTACEPVHKFPLGHGSGDGGVSRLQPRLTEGSWWRLRESMRCGRWYLTEAEARLRALVALRWPEMLTGEAEYDL